MAWQAHQVMLPAAPYAATVPICAEHWTAALPQDKPPAVEVSAMQAQAVIMAAGQHRLAQRHWCSAWTSAVCLGLCWSSRHAGWRQSPHMEVRQLLEAEWAPLMLGTTVWAGGGCLKMPARTTIMMFSCTCVALSSGTQFIWLPACHHPKVLFTPPAADIGLAVTPGYQGML